MTDVRVKSAELLAAHGKYPLFSEHLPDTTPAQQAYISARMSNLGYFRYFEFFQPTQPYIETILNETQRRASALPIMGRQFISPGLNLTDSIAAFMIVQGDYSYYSASTGWFDKDWSWHAEYAPRYGLPAGEAVRDGDIYTRAFTGCVVTVNCTGAGTGNCKGDIVMHHD